MLLNLTFRELRLSVLSAASKARRLADNSTARQKHTSAPETLSADDELSTSSALPAAILHKDAGGSTCRLAAILTRTETTSCLTTTPQPITRQYDESAHSGLVRLADAPQSSKHAMTSADYVYLCPQTADVAQRISTD